MLTVEIRAAVGGGPVGIDEHWLRAGVESCVDGVVLAPFEVRQDGRRFEDDDTCSRQRRTG